MSLTRTLTTAAVTGILAGATACGGQSAPPAAPEGEAPAAAASGAPASPEAANDRIPADNDSSKASSKHDCKGQNDCKGRGGCKTDLNTCRGKNECKGRGGCKSI